MTPQKVSQLVDDILVTRMISPEEYKDVLRIQHMYINVCKTLHENLTRNISVAICIVMKHNDNENSNN